MSPAVQMMSAGQRTHAVTIQVRVADVGESGFPVETWEDLACVAMSRSSAMAFDRFAESMQASTLSARSYDEWVMPYLPDVDPDVVNVPAERRLLYGARVYDIVAAQRIGNAQIRLTTIAKVG